MISQTHWFFLALILLIFIHFQNFSLNQIEIWIEYTIFIKSLGLLKFDMEHFPLFCAEFSLRTAWKGYTRLIVTTVLEVVIANGKFGIRFLYVRFVNNANVTTTKNWSFVRVAGDGKLHKIELESLSHV